MKNYWVIKMSQSKLNNINQQIILPNMTILSKYFIFKTQKKLKKIKKKKLVIYILIYSNWNKNINKKN